MKRAARLVFLVPALFAMVFMLSAMFSGPVLVRQRLFAF